MLFAFFKKLRIIYFNSLKLIGIGGNGTTQLS